MGVRTPGGTGELTAGLVFSTFLTGGMLGVLGASVLEAYLLHPSPWLFLGVGLIEEAVKLVALMVLTCHLRTRSLRDGMIRGAARLDRVASPVPVPPPQYGTGR
nr:hypothetical protein GCM10020092_033110 [Actinoplanes digitatis]